MVLQLARALRLAVVLSTSTRYLFSASETERATETDRRTEMSETGKRPGLTETQHADSGTSSATEVSGWLLGKSLVGPHCACLLLTPYSVSKYTKNL